MLGCNRTVIKCRKKVSLALNELNETNRRNLMVKIYMDRIVLRSKWGNQETINQRTENTKTKRKRTNNNLQNIHKKLKIEQHKPGMNSIALEGLAVLHH